MPKLICNVNKIPRTELGHVHDHAHILLPISGEIDVVMDDMRYTIPPQHLSFIPPGRFHHCISQSNILVINIPATMIHSDDLEPLSTLICIPTSDSLELLTQLIKLETTSNSDSDSIRYLYYYLYAKLMEAACHKSQRYIKEHFGEAITISQLAKLENYHPNYYSDWFKRQTGMSPSLYIQKVRMEKSKELLLCSDFSLTQIAHQVGYSSSAAFSRVFHKTVGLSPSDFRKNAAAEK